MKSEYRSFVEYKSIMKWLKGQMQEWHEDGFEVPYSSGINIQPECFILCVGFNEVCLCKLPQTAPLETVETDCLMDLEI